MPQKLTYEELEQKVLRLEKVEESLKESERRFDSLTHNLHGITFRGNLDFTPIYFRGAVEEITGYSAEDFLEKSITWDMVIHPEDRPRILKDPSNTALRNCCGYYTDREYRILRKDSNVRWVYEAIHNISDDLDIPIFVEGVLLDVTDKKQAEKALEKRIVALTKPLNDIGHIHFEELFNLDDIQSLQDEFAQATGVASIITRPDGTPITKASNFCRLCQDIIRRTDKGLSNCFKSDAVLGRYNTDGPTIQPCLSGGLWDAGAAISVGGKHVANWLIGQVRNEAQNEDRMRAYAQDIGVDEETMVEAFLEVPSMSLDQFGKVAQVLFTLANQLSTTAYQNVQQARFITERKRTEDALRRSEEKYRALLKTTSEGFWLLNPERKTIEVNEALCKMLGYTQDEMLEKTPFDFVDDENRKIFIEQTSKISTTGHRSYEIALRTKKGDSLHTYFNATTIKDELGEVQGSFALITDITENKRMAEVLRESEEKYRSMMEAMDDPIYICSPDLRVEYVNPAMIRDVGHDAKGESCSQAIFGLDTKCPWCVHEKIQKGDSVFTEIFNPKNGHTYHVSNSPIFHADNSISKMTIFRDITQRKHLEEEREKLIKELQTALAEIKTLSGLLPICSYCKKIRDDKGYWNQIEAYIGDRSEAVFSHSICKECAEKYYPDMDIYDDDNETQE